MKLNLYKKFPISRPVGNTRSPFSWQSYWSPQKFGDGTQFDNGKVLIHLDDGYADNLTIGLPVFQARNCKATLYLNTGIVGGVDFMTWAQVLQLKNSGLFDIQCHSDVSVTGDDASIIADLNTVTSKFITNGLPIPVHHAYPGGEFTDRTVDVIDDLRSTARTTVQGIQIDRKSDFFKLPSYGMSSLPATIATLKAAMDTAKANKTGICIYGHRVNVEGTPLSITAESLAELIDYGQSIGVDFITISELYELMFYMDLRLSRNCAGTQIDIRCKNRLNPLDRISIERSDDDGVTYAEITTLAPGVTNYSDTGLTLNKNYYYRARGYRGTHYLPYSGVKSTSTLLTFVLTSTGNGTGVATLSFTGDETVDLTLDGTGKFYTDAAGTLGESATFSIKPNTAATIYIRVPSGVSNLTINKDCIREINAYTAGTNAPSLGGDLSLLRNLKIFNITGLNSLSGDVSKLTRITYLSITGSNTLSGSIAGLTGLTYLKITGSNTVSGSITNLTSLTTLVLDGSNTVSGSITGLTNLTYLLIKGSNTVTGSLNGLVNLTYLYMTGANTVSGDIKLISAKLTYVLLNPCAVTDYTTGGDWSDLAAAAYLQITPSAGSGLSKAEMSLFVLDVYATKIAGRVITFVLNGANESMADTNQGGIWGDFSGAAAPSALATAYKSLKRTDSCTVSITGITAPGASGDGTGFPAGFGNWYRS